MNRILIRLIKKTIEVLIKRKNNKQLISMWLHFLQKSNEMIKNYTNWKKSKIIK